ncbi:colipase-like [Anomaloglossus baeobatrachus]
MIQNKNTIAFLLLFLLLCFEVSQSALIFNLDNGELCATSVQCKSKCCQRGSGLSVARCAPRAAETKQCSRLHLYVVYYRCPCERGLTCEPVGESIINTEFGYCHYAAK